MRPLLEAISNIAYMKGSTNIGKAIEYARKNMFTLKAGHRPDASKIVVVITDGKFVVPVG